MKNGRIIGERFENAVCRILSAWYDRRGAWNDCPVADLPFRRRTTSRMPLVGHWKGTGDVLWREDVPCRFAIECKKRESWELDGAFHCPAWPVLSWWQQAVRQATKMRLRPLLFFHRNRRAIYVMAYRKDAIWSNAYLRLNDPSGTPQDVLIAEHTAVWVPLVQDWPSPAVPGGSPSCAPPPSSSGSPAIRRVIRRLG